MSKLTLPPRDIHILYARSAVKERKNRENRRNKRKMVKLRKMQFQSQNRTHHTQRQLAV